MQPADQSRGAHYSLPMPPVAPTMRAMGLSWVVSLGGGGGRPGGGVENKIGPAAIVEVAGKLTSCYTSSNDGRGAGLGAVPILPRGLQAPQPVRRGAGAGAHAADGRAPRRCARVRARGGAVHALTGGARPPEAAAALVPHVEAMASAASTLQRVASGEAEDEGGAGCREADEMIEERGAARRSPRTARPKRIVVELGAAEPPEDVLRREAPTSRSAWCGRPRTRCSRANRRPAPGPARAPALREGAPGCRRNLAALQAHPLIGFDEGTPVQRVRQAGHPARGRCSRFAATVTSASTRPWRAGFGIGVCQVALAKRDKLVPLLTGTVGFEMEMWVAMHKDLKTSRRMRLMFDHLVEHLRGLRRPRRSERHYRGFAESAASGWNPS